MKVKTKKRFFCIVGAGFSHVLNPKMPLCSGVVRSFVDRILSREDKNDLSGWRTIAHLACHGFFGVEAKVKTAGCSLTSAFQMYDYFNSSLFNNYLINQTDFKTHALAPEYEKLIKDEGFYSNRLKVIRDLSLDRSIDRLRDILKTTPSLYQNINIEELLKQEKILGYEPHEAIGDSFDSIFFQEFQNPIVEEKTAGYLKIFFSNLEKHFNISFLSFNYDLMLETLLFSQGKWNDFTGYALPFDFFITAADAKSVSNHYWDHENDTPAPLALQEIPNERDSVYKMYKPHGSINWLADHETGEMVLIRKSEPNEELDISGGQFGYMDISTNKERDLTTVLLPPLPTKSSSLPKLWEQSKNIKTAFEQADVVMVIGWGCPDSDQNWCRQLENIFNSRDKQLEKLIVVNPDRSVFTRLNAIMQPRSGHDFGGFKDRNLSGELLHHILDSDFLGTIRYL